ncbi:MAG: hypothetical protein H6510_17060 [Acidobacteria bacterium]|nr:hypothetical protein [Acidobacteriota bacterium]MCB9399524.1 hypothetical protein [Acidobacteriota bacterium]
MVLFIWLLCQEGAAFTTPLQKFPYTYYITTGPSSYISQDGVEWPINLNQLSPLSDAQAVKALSTLRWNTLYPNKEGKITILGQFDAGGSFVLVHWYLEIPFESIYEKYPDQLENEVLSFQRTQLLPIDFEPQLEFDPVRFTQPTPPQMPNSH